MDLELFGLQEETCKYQRKIQALTASSVYRVCPDSDIECYNIYKVSFTLELLDNDLGDIDDINKRKRLLNPDDFFNLEYPQIASGVFLRAIMIKESDLKELESDLMTRGEALLKREPVYYFLSDNPFTIESIISPERSCWRERIEKGINAIMNHISR